MARKPRSRTASSPAEKPKRKRSTARKAAPAKPSPKAKKKTARKKRPSPAALVAAYVRRVVDGKEDDRTTRYAADVLAGRVVTGPWVRLAAERHLKDLERTDLFWDVEAANLKIAFFEEILKLNGGEFEGKPFLLQPWQAFNTGSIFGWKRLDGTRRFRKGLIETGKGNGKSPWIAGLGMIGLCADSEPRAEVYFGAPKKEQGFIPFRDAVAMVDLSDELSERIAKSGANPVWNLAHHSSGSFARVLSGEGRTSKGQGGTKSGFRPHFNLLDELHEHPNSIVVDMMLAGAAKVRRQPLTLAITNSGFDRNSICWQWHDYSVRVLQGLLRDDTWFAYVCALDDGDDPFNDRACWVKANPNLGVSVTEAQIQEQVDVARGMPTKRNGILRLHFCVWTQQEEQGVDLAAWDRCEAKIDPDALIDRECFAGIDLGSTADLTALELLFPAVEPGEKPKVLSWFWMPKEGVAEKVIADRVPYDHWIDEGLIIATPGNATDFDFVRAKVNELAERYRIKRIAVDPRDALQLMTQLGTDGFEVVKVAQNYEGLAAGTHQTLRMIGDAQIEHDGNPVLRTMVSNVSLVENANGDLRPDKRKSAGRIDGFVALVAAVDQADRHAPLGPSVWEQHSAEDWSGRKLAEVPPVNPDGSDDDDTPPGGSRPRRRSVYESEEWTNFAKEHGHS